MTTGPFDGRRPATLVVRALAVAALAVVVACSRAGAPGGTGPTDPPAAASSTAAGTSAHTDDSAAVASTGGATTSIPTSAGTAAGVPAPSPTSSASVRPVVAAGEVVRFTVRRGGDPLIDAGSSGVASYRMSPRCEVPGQPCYDAPTLDKIARMDVGGAPQSPGTQTTFVTGHSNRYDPTNPSRGVFSRLQEVRDGDVIEVETTTGRFEYTVTKTLRVAFDKLPSTDDVVRVRPDTLVAISCEIAPDRRSYLGNAVVVASLTSATPAPSP